MDNQPTMELLVNLLWLQLTPPLACPHVAIRSMPEIMNPCAGG